MTRNFTCLVLLAVACLAAGCNSSAATSRLPTGGSQPANRVFAGKPPLRAVATVGMVADIVENIGGEHVRVTSLMGEGVDPHLYKASPADVSQLSRADIVFYSGLHLEGKLAELLERMGERKPTVGVAERIAADKILTDDHGAHDPHAWFDVSLWSAAASAAADALAEFDSKHAADYKTRAAAYRQRLARLDAYAREQLATIPKERRVLVTAHDAFRYFGRAYDIEVRGIQGISTESEAGVRQVTELVDFLSQQKVKAVFVETSVSDQNIRSLLEGCAVRGHRVTIGGSLYSDAMGKSGTPDGTYEGMVKHNVDTIVAALR